MHRAGINKIVIFNSHGGQPQVMDIVARELRVRHGMLVVVLSWFGFGLPDGIVSRHEQMHGDPRRRDRDVDDASPEARGSEDGPC